MAYSGYHRSVAAGVALTSAGAIALASIALLPVERAANSSQVPHSKAHSVALANHADVLAAGALAALAESVHALQNDAPALLEQTTVQWPDVDLTHWNYALVADAVLAPVAPLVIGPFTDAVADFLARRFPEHGDAMRQRVPELIEYAVVRAVGPASPMDF